MGQQHENRYLYPIRKETFRPCDRCAARIGGVSNTCVIDKVRQIPSPLLGRIYELALKTTGLRVGVLTTGGEHPGFDVECERGGEITRTRFNYV